MRTRLSKRASLVNPSATLGITSKAKKMRREGIDVVSFGAGEPDYDTPLNIKNAAKDAIDKGITKYTPSTGLIELKEVISGKFKKDNNLIYETSQIIVSCGAKHSIFNSVFALCEEGDEVIIPSPYWLSYPEMVALSGAKSVIIKAAEKNNFKFTEKELSSSITPKTKLLILNSPSNPTGSIYSENELRFIAKLAKEKDFFVISDEIYEKITYTGKKPVSIASLDKDIYERTITVNGVSKSYSMTGWRIGYLACAKDIASAISNIQDHTTSNPTSISQIASLEALKGDQSFVDKMVNEFAKRRDYMVKRLNFIKGFKANNPDGAFYIFCDISSFKMNSMDFCSKLLEEANVAIIPGGPFGWDTHVRFSFATSMENITKGLDKIEKWVKQ